MSEPRRLLRLLKFISLLGDKIRRTTKEYAELLHVNRSTVNRYKKVLEEAGFVIHTNADNQLYINRDSLKQHPHLFFSEEEAFILNELIKTYDGPHRQDLLKKIYVNSSLPEITEDTLRARQARMYRTSKVAITTEKQLKIIGYLSVNSNTQQDRKVEPFRVLPGNLAVEAYDVEKKGVRHFHFDRMADVEATSVNHRFKGKHIPQNPDPFRVANSALEEVNLEMTLRAAQQMREQFPDTANYIQPDKHNKMIYQGPVNAQFKLLDRFLLSMCMEVKVIQPKRLIDHLNELWEQRTL